MISKKVSELGTWACSARFRRFRRRKPAPSLAHTVKLLVLILICAFSISNAVAQSPAGSFHQSEEWSTHAHDAQHTGVSPVASQKLARIHWQVPVDLAPPEGEIFIHYGSPVITAKNTVIVPVKTGTSSFRVQAHDGTTGKKLWTLGTAYQPPFAGFMPGLGVTLSQHHLLVPDVAGGILMRANPDNVNGTISHLYFYVLENYLADPSVYQQAVKINTPLTADADGNLYFGFQVIGSTPIGLRSGLARISRDGTGSWVSAQSISGDDPFVSKIATSCAPALSSDGSIVYVATGTFDFGFGYLVALDSRTLQVINRVRLTDPASGLDATMTDQTSASPTVGPDGDVYYGVLENPFPLHNNRGWLLHFNRNLSEEKIPGSFGWDDTASIVDASLVASYHGTSKYLLMTKYNNYANVSTGDGHNRIAILDPNAIESDPVIPTTNVMQEVITTLGVTPDPENLEFFPEAVREWCINTGAVDPFTKSVVVNSDDGKLYRWDLTTNRLSEVIRLSGGIGEAYTPTVVGTDGTVYAINDAV
jgi:outer membrane protein assembly factor BamB